MPTTSWSDFEPVTQDTDWSDFEPIKETPIIKPTPYQAADIESMTAGRGKAPTGMEAGTEFTGATAGAPALAIPSAIADALIRKSLLAGANIPSALSRVVSPLVGGEEVEPITELPEIKLPRAPGAGAASGLANVGLSTAEGLIQPANWPLLPLMGGGGALGKLAVTGFGAQQAGAIPQETIAAIQTLDDPNATRAEKVGALAKPGVTALLAGAMLRAGQPSPARDVAGMLSEAPMLPRELPEPEPIRAGALATERPVVNPENLISQLGLLEPKPTILPRPEVPRAPSRAFRPEVPATPAEERISAIDEIRQANARTIGEIQKLFPKAQLNREAARLLRDTAWGAKERTENAPEARKEPESDLRKREGVAPGTNLPADQPEVRQGQGEQAGGGNRPEPSKEVPGSEQVPLTPEQQAAEQARLAAELGQEPTPPTTSVESPPEAKAPTSEKGGPKTGNIAFESLDEPSGEWQKRDHPYVISKSTIPGDKPWRMTVFAGSEDSPVAIGHIQLDSPDVLPVRDLQDLSEQMGRYNRKFTISDYSISGEKYFYKPKPAPPEAKAPTPSDVAAEQGAVPTFAKRFDQETLLSKPAWVEPGSAFDKALSDVRENPDKGVDITPAWKSLTTKQRQELLTRGWTVRDTRTPGQVILGLSNDAIAARKYFAVTSPLRKATQEVQKVARTEGQRSAKEVKSELVARLEKAIEEAPLAADVEEKTATDQGFRKIITQPDTRTKITIDIPGDGVFTIWNTKEALTEVLSRAKKISTSAESKATVPRKAIAQSGQAIRSGEMAKEGVRADKAKELQGKARVAMTDAINQSENEGIIAHQEMDLDPVTDQKRMREWQIRRATPDERTEYWKRNRRELGWVVESRIIKFDEKGNRQVGEWGFSTEGRTRADAIRSTEADVVPPDAVLVDEGLKNWRHIENKTGPFSYIAEGLPPGPGAQTRGEPPYPAISQLTDRLKATPPAGLKDSIPVKERIAEEWARGKSQVTKAVARMRAITESLKDTVRGVRTPTELDRKVAEFDTAIQLSAGRSRQAASAIRRQMRSQTMREAVAIWIDSAGNEKAIQFALDNLPKGIRPSVKRALEASLKLSPEAKSFAEDLKQFYGIRENDAVSHELFEQGLKDYYTHIWEKEQNMPDELRAAFVNGRLSTYFQFSRQRKIPMFLQGILAGKTPVLDPAKVVPFYNYAMDRAIASREFIKQASEVVMPDGRPLLSPSGTRSVIEKGETPEALIIRPKARSEENADYHQVDHPALRKWKWAGTGESGEPILYQGDLLVHPEGFNRLANMMDRGRLTPSKWGGRLLQASTEVKGFKLGMLSLFHNIHVGSHAAFHWTNPFKAIGKEIDWDAPGTKFAIEKGHLKIAPDPSELRIAAEGIMGPGIVHKIPLIGPLSKAWSEWTFGEMIPQLKLATFENAYKRNIWARDNLPLTGLKGLTDEEVAARVGDSVNNAFGELNHMFLGKYGRNPQFQRVLRGIFLAPDFGEARLRFAGKAFTKAGFEERLALATMFTTLYLGARVANFISHGDPEWDWKKAFAVKAGQHWWSMRSVIGDIDRAAADFGRFMYVRLNPLYSRTAADFLFGRDISGRKLTTSQKIGNVFKQLIPIQMGGLTRDDQKLWESFVGAMGLSAQRDRPEQDVSRAVSSWMSKSKDPKIQQKFQQHEGEVFAQSVYAPLRFALEAEDYGKAHDEYEKLLKIRKPSQIRDYMAKDIRTMGGLSVPEFNQFQKQMSPEEKKLLQQAKDNRKVLYQRYLRMTRNGTAINR